MPEQLPDTLTHIDPPELASALVTAWRSLFGFAPARESILVLLAQSALETGRWHSCHAFNLGNAKHVAGDGRDFTFYRCNEVIGGKVVWFDPPSPSCCFRAYRTLDEGATDYLGILRKRYSAAWSAVLSGDPHRFVRALKQLGYFTADLAPYEAAVASLFREYQAGIIFDVTAEPPAFTDAERARVLAIVGFHLADDLDLLRRADTLPDETETRPDLKTLPES